MRSRGLKRLVVNASVARAAGGKGATASVSINCTEFLETFRDECPHRIVMTPELSEEWNAHQSNFAARWLKSMIARKRFDYITPPQDTALSDKIDTTATKETDIEALRKDFHLLHAALATNQTVISLDEAIRHLFVRASQQVGEIQNIIWVNPGKVEELPIAWLQNGAPPEAHRRLSAYPTE
ncbi:MAG: hypothetical protein OXM61_18875 [Candidatus Poribacteria bacterium]|nr:hypothetical protein [Candidatus Poribacteria bacterium]